MVSPFGSVTLRFTSMSCCFDLDERRLSGVEPEVERLRFSRGDRSIDRRTDTENRRLRLKPVQRSTAAIQIARISRTFMGRSTCTTVNRYSPTISGAPRAGTPETRIRYVLWTAGQSRAGGDRLFVRPPTVRAISRSARHNRWSPLEAMSDASYDG